MLYTPFLYLWSSLQIVSCNLRVFVHVKKGCYSIGFWGVTKQTQNLKPEVISRHCSEIRISLVLLIDDRHWQAVSARTVCSLAQTFVGTSRRVYTWWITKARAPNWLKRKVFNLELPRERVVTTNHKWMIACYERLRLTDLTCYMLNFTLLTASAISCI